MAAMPRIQTERYVKCILCGRRLDAPRYSLAGKPVGPRCAKKAAIPLDAKPSKPTRAKRMRLFDAPTRPQPVDPAQLALVW